MSMQICVLADSRLASIAEWQKAIDVEGFPLQLSDADSNVNLAARLPNEETSIEYGIYDFSELKETCKDISFGRDWRYAIAFTWSTDFSEEIAAWMAATAYARATDGVVFDEQEGRLFTPEESLQMTREIERRRPEMEAMLRSYVERLAATSPEIGEALQAVIQGRSPKND